MAMTAWSANAFSVESCFSDSDPGSMRTTLSNPIASPARTIGIMVMARIRWRGVCDARCEVGRRFTPVWNVDHPAVEDSESVHVFA